MSGSNFGLAPPVVVNPLAAQTTALDAAGKVYDLRDKQATEAWGNALQQATDADGNVNYPRAQALASKDPLARQGMLKALGQTSTIQGQQLEQGIARNRAVSNAIVGALDGDDAGLHDRVVGGLQSLVANGGWTQEQATRAALALPADPTQLRQRLQQIQISLMPTSEQTTQIQGRQVTVDQGTGIVGGVQQPASRGGGISTSGAAVPVYAPPGTQGGQVKWTDSDGVEHNTTWAEYNVARGNGRVVGGATVVSPSGGGGASSPPPIPPPPGTTPRGSGTGTGAPTPPAQKPTLTDTTGPVPGSPEAKRKVAEDSAAAATALTTRADQVPANKASYSNMMADLEAINSGPGTEREKNVNAFMQKWTGRGLTMTKDQVASAENYAKLANIIIGQQLAAIGGTDARQALFMGSNPNLELSKLGNKRILNLLQGNEDAVAAKSRAWQNWLLSGNGPDSYPRFQNEFNKHFDPRVFQAIYMEPPEIAALRRSMKPEDQKKFLDDYDYARAQKWIP